MKFRRIKTVKTPATGNANQLTIELADGRTYALTRAQLSQFVTAAALKTAIVTALGSPLPDLWCHRNRNGTWAIATGQEPEIWPEDDEKVISG
jgi:hypothetical protein